jgi:hypothetical protein
MAVNQVIPIRDDIVHWAAALAKGDTTIHATRALARSLVI